MSTRTLFKGQEQEWSIQAAAGSSGQVLTYDEVTKSALWADGAAVGGGTFGVVFQEVGGTGIFPAGTIDVYTTASAATPEPASLHSNQTSTTVNLSGGGSQIQSSTALPFPSIATTKIVCGVCIVTDSAGSKLCTVGFDVTGDLLIISQGGAFAAGAATIGAFSFGYIAV
jgi:hypothetical protein